MRRLRRSILTGALCVTLAACSSTSNEEADGEAGSILRLAVNSQITSLNPLPGAPGQTHMAHQLIWDALVANGSDNEFEPRLAESWDVNDDASVWTLQLRDDVSWSDGETFDSEDVVFSLHLYSEPESGSAYAGSLLGTEVRAVDASTVEIALDAPNSGFLEGIVNLSILPEHVYGEVPLAELNDHELFREPPAGIGPYVFEAWVSDDQLELKANPEYRHDLGFERAFVSTLTNDAALAQLESGDVDFAPLASSDVERVEGLPDITVHRTPGVGPQAYFSPFDTGPFQDTLTRQAVMHAIDRDAIVEAVLNGEGVVADQLMIGPDWALADDLPGYDYDPDRARQLLDEAGWDDSRVVRLEVWPGSAERETVATIVAAQLQDVGISAQVEPIELAEVTQRMDDRDFDMIFSSAGNFSRDPAIMNSTLMCDQQHPVGINVGNYCNEELDALLTEALTLASEEERAPLYQEAQRIVHDELPILFLYTPNVLAATGPGLQGFEITTEGYTLFGNAADWTPGS